MYKSLFGEEETGLSREDLAALMLGLGHPEDEIELESIFREWDIDHRGYLDFDAFLSLIATFLKREELDEMMENDFLDLCGIKGRDCSNWQFQGITAANLVHIYSTSYMESDPHLGRFMGYLSLFTFFMLLLVKQKET